MERKDYKYLEAVDTNITIEAGDVTSYLGGLFGGDPTLGKWKVFFRRATETFCCRESYEQGA